MAVNDFNAKKYVCESGVRCNELNEMQRSVWSLRYFVPIIISSYSSTERRAPSLTNEVKNKMGNY